MYNVNRDRKTNTSKTEDKTMNKKLTMVALTMCIGLVAFAHHGWNHMLGIEAIRGVSYVLGGAVRPAPVVVSTPTTVVAPAPVVTTTPVVTTPVVTTVPSYSYGYYNNVYCPTYSGYYYYGNNWVWGGGPWHGHRPPPPMWRPHYGGPHHGGHHHHHR